MNPNDYDDTKNHKGTTPTMIIKTLRWNTITVITMWAEANSTERVRYFYGAAVWRKYNKERKKKKNIQ